MSFEMASKSGIFSTVPMLKIRCLPDSDIEDIGAYRRRDCHVTLALLGHQHAGDQVWHGGAGRQKRETHHLMSRVHTL